MKLVFQVLDNTVVDGPVYRIEDTNDHMVEQSHQQMAAGRDLQLGHTSIYGVLTCVDRKRCSQMLVFFVLHPLLYIL